MRALRTYAFSSYAQRQTRFWLPILSCAPRTSPTQSLVMALGSSWLRWMVCILLLCETLVLQPDPPESARSSQERTQYAGYVKPGVCSHRNEDIHPLGEVHSRQSKAQLAL